MLCLPTKGNELSVETIAAQKAKKAELSEKNRAAAQASYLELYEASSPEIKRCLVLGPSARKGCIIMADI